MAPPPPKKAAPVEPIITGHNHDAPIATSFVQPDSFHHNFPLEFQQLLNLFLETFPPSRVFSPPCKRRLLPRPGNGSSTALDPAAGRPAPVAPAPEQVKSFLSPAPIPDEKWYDSTLEAILAPAITSNPQQIESSPAVMYPAAATSGTKQAEPLPAAPAQSSTGGESGLPTSRDNDEEHPQTVKFCHNHVIGQYNVRYDPSGRPSLQVEGKWQKLAAAVPMSIFKENLHNLEDVLPGLNDLSINDSDQQPPAAAGTDEHGSRLSPADQQDATGVDADEQSLISDHQVFSDNNSYFLRDKSQELSEQSSNKEFSEGSVGDDGEVDLYEMYHIYAESSDQDESSDEDEPREMEEGPVHVDFPDPDELPDLGQFQRPEGQGASVTSADDIIQGSEIAIDDSEIAPTPPGFVYNLHLHQGMGLKWMIDQEQNPTMRGGMLADEMGLGKTLQILALIALRHGRAADGTRPSPTLVICPLSILNQWKGETRTKIHQGPHTLTFVDGRDPQSKRMSFEQFKTYDVVFATFEVIRNEHKKHQTGASAFFIDQFERIVIDESQKIKDRESKITKAVWALQAKYRWLVTGTPIQNRVTDMFSSIAFLKIAPYNVYSRFSKRWAVLMELDKKRDKAPPPEQSEAFEAMLSGFMLRRTKGTIIHGKPIHGLKPPVHDNVDVQLGESYKKFYQQIEHNIQTDFLRLQMSKGGRKGNRALGLLHRLRWACCHPFLLTETVDVEGVTVRPELAQYIDQGTVLNLRRLRKEAKAPANRKRLLKALDLVWQDSPKINTVLPLVTRIKNSGAKVLLFSQWPSFLDLIQYKMQKLGMVFTRFDGTMPPSKRDAAVKRLGEDSDCAVMLISTDAGNVGLNLTMASHVILMEPHWNPYVELQAGSRVHRLGQTQPVFVHHVRIQADGMETVEDRVLKLQEFKRLQIDAIMGDADVKEKIRAAIEADKDNVENDIAFLVGMRSSPSGQSPERPSRAVRDATRNSAGDEGEGGGLTVGRRLGATASVNNARPAATETAHRPDSASRTQTLPGPNATGRNEEPLPGTIPQPTPQPGPRLTYVPNPTGSTILTRRFMPNQTVRPGPSQSARGNSTPSNVADDTPNKDVASKTQQTQQAQKRPIGNLEDGDEGVRDGSADKKAKLSGEGPTVGDKSGGEAPGEEDEPDSKEPRDKGDRSKPN